VKDISTNIGTFVRRTTIGPNAPKPLKPVGRRIVEPSADQCSGKCQSCGAEDGFGIGRCRCACCGEWSPNFAAIMAWMKENAGTKAAGEAAVCLWPCSAYTDLAATKVMANSFSASVVLPFDKDDVFRFCPSKFVPVVLVTDDRVGSKKLSAFKHPKLAFYIFGHDGSFLPKKAVTVDLPASDLSIVSRRMNGVPPQEERCLRLDQYVSIVMSDRIAKLKGLHAAVAAWKRSSHA
jgi:hypothetical protein